MTKSRIPEIDLNMMVICRGKYLQKSLHFEPYLDPVGLLGLGFRV